MQVTVIPVDNLIIVNTEPLFFPFESPEHIHAIQWQNGKGHIEYTDGMLNMTIEGKGDYDSHVAPFVLQWEQQKQLLKEEEKRLAAEQGALVQEEGATI